ncbi:arylsulfate sulfotransferase [gut metagenome]|uniref:Arylsulfate sulfotransferase n=1 Tax=gut metagenome TaxID=749906 RepID=J9FKY9_9ZZZZ
MRVRMLPVMISVMVLGLCASNLSYAVGGPSGLAVQYKTQGQIGETVVNPYGLAPLTAVIRNGGYVLKQAHVRVLPKKGGQEIRYSVGPSTLLTHGGIPIFGLYPDWKNQVEVTYIRSLRGEEKEITETYDIWTAPVWTEVAGDPSKNPALVQTKVVKEAPKAFADRLYLLNNLGQVDSRSARVVWNNPEGGALQWNNLQKNVIVDTQGEIRWYLKPEKIYDPESIYQAGIMMGFHQNEDGALSWGYGQRYVKYDLLGREIFNRRLPVNYADFSHAMMPGENGHYFLRVASSDFRRPDNTRVHTVRDVIIEVEPDGTVLDEWRLFDILDPNRKIVLKSIDQGAVCLNVNAEMAGKTLTAEQLDETGSSKTPLGILPERGSVEIGLTSTQWIMTPPMIPSFSLPAISRPL